jgi:dTDP-4-amino-4,6-dideoxygalactose transaminase
MKIPFLSFDFQNKITRESLIESITEVIDSKSYVLSKNVLSFEENFSKINRL